MEAWKTELVEILPGTGKELCEELLGRRSQSSLIANVIIFSKSGFSKIGNLVAKISKL